MGIHSKLPVEHMQFFMFPVYVAPPQSTPAAS